MIRKRFAELQAIGYNNLNVKRQDEYNQLAAALYTTEGGRFAEHTGKAPVWIDICDPSRSRNHNIKVAGSGEYPDAHSTVFQGVNYNFDENDLGQVNKTITSMNVLDSIYGMRTVGLDKVYRADVYAVLERRNYKNYAELPNFGIRMTFSNSIRK